MRRAYQTNFYTLSQRVRDPSSRQEKAEKIIWALTQYVKCRSSSPICLDVGCSSGMITSALASLFSTTVGLEYDTVALRAVDEASRARVQFVRGDAMNLPFDNDVIDVIICAQVYEHVPDDERMFEEIYRVLKPGGAVFFSGPNWLFPIEPHYFLPFLHWLPDRLASFYLRMSRRGTRYYERSRHLWGLRRLASCFSVQDISVEILRQWYMPRSGKVGSVLQRLPEWLWRALLPLFPNFNWILHKPLE
ncbi:MAG: class I SAM-dependent methyltransferase [Roseiflexus sp.]